MHMEEVVVISSLIILQLSYLHFQHEDASGEVAYKTEMQNGRDTKIQS